MKILNVDDLLVAAGSELPAADVNDAIRMLECAAEIIATRLAAKLDVELHDVSNQPGFGGLCATFSPRLPSQTCPPSIELGDPEGEWESRAAAG